MSSLPLNKGLSVATLTKGVQQRDDHPSLQSEIDDDLARALLHSLSVVFFDKYVISRRRYQQRLFYEANAGSAIHRYREDLQPTRAKVNTIRTLIFDNYDNSPGYDCEAKLVVDNASRISSLLWIER